MKILKVLFYCILIGVIFILGIKPALAFCGFYVAKADSSLYNQASQIIIARDGKRTVLTMSNDYQGEVKNFAMVVPVPVILTEEQVHIADPKIIERLDAFSAPRLVEYFDKDPACILDDVQLSAVSKSSMKKSDSVLGVAVEEQFSVGEYDIVILSARKSNGLEKWLVKNGYKIPQGTKELLQPYIRQKMKFFVAKVNLEQYNETAAKKLSPISIDYESAKFMLPIRLGMINVQKEQDLVVYLLSPDGQVELTNYRTLKIPSNAEVPEFIEDEFSNFYQAMFDKTYIQGNKKSAVLEYAWDMMWCDPCSADPLSLDELKQAGVFWFNRETNLSWLDRLLNKKPEPHKRRAYLTRLHIRYTRDRFPEDLVFQSTSNQELFQGRYVISHPYTQEIGSTCKSRLPKIVERQGKEIEPYLQQKIQEYPQQVAARKEKEIQNLIRLTDWNVEDIRNKIVSHSFSS